MSKKYGGRWLWIWAAPILAAVITGYYFYERAQDRGPKVTLRFSDATGLKAGQSQVVHLGVQIGQVTAIQLSPDKKQALVQIQLHRSQSAFAQKGSLFWIVRPEISVQEISGLGTVLSGPVIDALPGNGEMQTEFTGLDKPPTLPRAGLHIVLKTPHSERLQKDSPIYYRDIQVGFVEEVHLGTDATTVDIHALIQPRYTPLVKENSEFWAVPAVDLKGSIFTGIQMKVESLRSLLSGGIAFATPEDNMGEEAHDGVTFAIHDEAKKDWQAWSTRISIEPDGNRPDELSPKRPGPPRGLGTATGSK